MTTPPPPQGFMGLPDLGGIVGQLTDLLPKEVKDAIGGTVTTILSPDGDINIGDPQPPGERPIPVEPGTSHFNAAVRAIDTALGALDVLMKLSFVIPDQYEGYITKLQGALKTIRGWLD